MFYSNARTPVTLAAEVHDEDDDVRAERAAVQALPRAALAAHSLVCRDLTKYYDDFLAVNRLTFGECLLKLFFYLDRVEFELYFRCDDMMKKKQEFFIYFY